MSSSSVNYYFKFVKEIDNEFVTYNYCSIFYTKTEGGKFKLYGFNGGSENKTCVIHVNGKGGNYQKVYVENLDGKVIDSHVVPYDTYKELQEEHKNKAL